MACSYCYPIMATCLDLSLHHLQATNHLSMVCPSDDNVATNYQKHGCHGCQVIVSRTYNGSGN